MNCSETRIKARTNMSAIQTAALKEFETILRKALPSVELPENLVDLLLATMKDSERDRLNDFSFVKPKIDMVNKSSLKTVVKLLPFMPDRLDYMMDQGRCCAIEFDHGLFNPCCKSCGEGQKFCKGHTEKPSPFGEYEDRLTQWNDGLGVGTMEFEVDGKKYVEATFGEYLLDKKIAPEQVKQALKEAGLAIRLAPHDMQVRPKTKKARGRPSEKKVETLEGEEAPAPVADKPKRVKLTEEERKARDEKEAAEKAERAVKRDADRKVIAERKAAEAIVKAQEQAAKLKQKADEADRKAREALAGKAKTQEVVVPEAPGKAKVVVKTRESAAKAKTQEAIASGEVKTKPKAKNPVKAASPVKVPSPAKSQSPDWEPLGTPLDVSMYYKGFLDEMECHEDEETGEKFWVDDERNVYNASKKKIGFVNEEGEVEML